MMDELDVEADKVKSGILLVLIGGGYEEVGVEKEEDGAGGGGGKADGSVTTDNACLC